MLVFSNLHGKKKPKVALQSPKLASVPIIKIVFDSVWKFHTQSLIKRDIAFETSAALVSLRLNDEVSKSDRSGKSGTPTAKGMSWPISSLQASS